MEESAILSIHIVAVISLFLLSDFHFHEGGVNAHFATITYPLPVCPQA
ncbi:hypothetical protein [Methanogenium cariaci]|nr:hypothetical protein [Methanogenium cariaci]